MTTRADVIAEARLWLGTPYHHRARVRGHGVDCANLPAAVYEACGLIGHVDPEYSPQWMMHRDEEVFLSYILERSREISREEALPGDLIIWKFGRVYSHSGILTDLPEVIHAVNHEGVVLGNIDRDQPLIDRPCKFFTLW